MFGLTLVVNHCCNLRCDYCYMGAKTGVRMEPGVGRRAIDRAAASVERGGRLELGFFGGEPLLDAGLVLEFAAHARARAAEAGVGLRLALTTNGTQDHARAREVMEMPDLELAVSFDGLPEVHDLHRRDEGGRGSSAAALATLRRLVAAGRPPRAVMVVRPDTVDRLAEGVKFLYGLGIIEVEPSLDLWTRWEAQDATRLTEAVAALGRVWSENLPHRGLAWFDDKLAGVSGLPLDPCARCGYGVGEVAVAPSGRLYPCERLVGRDDSDSPVRLPGHALDGEDFLGGKPAPARAGATCSGCDIRELCSTTCRCSNFVRTGDVSRPDGLLCLLDRLAFREAVAVRQEMAAAGAATERS